LPAAVTLASMTGLVQVAGRLVEVTIGHRISAVGTVVASSGLQVLAFVLLLTFQGVTILPAFVVIYALSNGLMTIARATAPLELFETAQYASMMGRLSIPFSIMNAVAPLAVAVAMRHFGTIPTLWIAASLSCTGLVAALYLWAVSRRA
jgi:hypothetical protein